MGVLLTPIYIKPENGKLVYYWCIFLLLTWGINDGSCILTTPMESNNKILLNNGPIIELINKVGLQTSSVSNYLIRLVATLSTIGVLYYYSNRDMLQKLIVWCLSWTFFTIETLRYSHIRNNGMIANTFKGFMREFKRENLHFWNTYVR